MSGSGADSVFGGRGNDSAYLGSGDDRCGWAPGDGNDRVEGQSGNDTQLFLGAGVNENVTITNNRGRVKFFRDVANVTMDLNGIEVLDTDLRTGTDTTTVGNLAGTDVDHVLNRLGNNPGSQGRIIANGTRRIDRVDVIARTTRHAPEGTVAHVLGLPCHRIPGGGYRGPTRGANKQQRTIGSLRAFRPTP